MRIRALVLTPTRELAVADRRAASPAYGRYLRPPTHRRLRRREPAGSGGGAARLARRARRDARAAPRSHPAGRRPPRRRHPLRPRRGRPHARHGLRARRAARDLRVAAGAQTLLFSATIPAAIESLANSDAGRPGARLGARRPSRTADDRRAVGHVRRQGRQARGARARPARRRASSAPSSSRARSTARTASPSSSSAPGIGVRRHPRQQVAEAPASERSRRSGAATTRVLVATDVAARGIDVDGISHVINFDLPNVAEELRAPHRPHRPRRRVRHRDLVLRSRRALGSSRDIERLIRRRLTEWGTKGRETA